MQPAILIGGLDGDLAGPVYAHGSAFAVELIKTFTFFTSCLVSCVCICCTCCKRCHGFAAFCGTGCNFILNVVLI